MIIQTVDCGNAFRRIEIKLLHSCAKLPKKATEGSIGFDVWCTGFIRHSEDVLEYKTGIALKVPAGVGCFAFPRSSVSNKDLILSNSVGVIDHDYTGEITFRYRLTNSRMEFYQPGERIGQLVFVLLANVQDFCIVEELKKTERGAGGYGSTGV